MRCQVESLISVWTNLPAQRKLAVILATVLAFSAVIALGRMSGGNSMSLLYGGLDSGAAGEVLQSLDAAGVRYEVRGSAIYVETGQRDTLRMTLASQGLPANGAQGYELLDGLSGFSTTSQMFDAAFWRAREGELARTIVASPFVTAARVHISAPTGRGFQREIKPTAAVTVTTGDGSLSPGQAKAFRYLVASSVPGLRPEDVAVIDGQGGLVAFAEEAGQSGNDLSEEIRERVQRLLEARVGMGNAVVEVAVDTVNETEQIIERRIDPESRIAISTDVSESSSNAQNSGRGGDVTVASNLPDGDAGNGGESSNSQGSETRQITNFEVSETQRELVRGPGAIKRITVAALVNHAESVAADGSVTTAARGQDELDALRSLIASAVGFDDARGDQITIQSLAFEPMDARGTEVTEAGLPGAPLDVMSLIRLGVMAGVALVLGLFVVRPVLMTPARQDDAAGMLALPERSGARQAEQPNGDDLELPMMAPIAAIGLDGGNGQSDPVDRLRDLIEDRPDETLQILQSWMEDPAARVTEKA